MTEGMNEKPPASVNLCEVQRVLLLFSQLPVSFVERYFYEILFLSCLICLFVFLNDSYL